MCSELNFEFAAQNEQLLRIFCVLLLNHQQWMMRWRQRRAMLAELQYCVVFVHARRWLAA